MKETVRSWLSEKQISYTLPSALVYRVGDCWKEAVNLLDHTLVVNPRRFIVSKQGSLSGKLGVLTNLGNRC